MWRLTFKRLGFIRQAARTHSKERIQHPRAIPSRILRVRRGFPDTTCVVLSHTVSTTVKPPSVFTTCMTVCCFLTRQVVLSVSEGHTNWYTAIHKKLDCFPTARLFIPFIYVNLSGYSMLQNVQRLI